MTCHSWSPATALTLRPISGWAAAADDVPSPDEVKAAIGHLGPVPVPRRQPDDEGEGRSRRAALQRSGPLRRRLDRLRQTCHLPDHGFAVDQPLGPAYPSKQERRNSPTLVNVAFNQPLIWDGRAPTPRQAGAGADRQRAAHEQQSRPAGRDAAGHDRLSAGIREGVRRPGDHAGADRPGDRHLRADACLRRRADRPLHGRRQRAP